MLNAAWYRVEPSLLVAGATGDPLWIPATWCVVDHPRGVVLIDTGVAISTFEPIDHPGDPSAPRRGGGFDTHRALRALGLRPEDVTVVVNTHLHVDHAGQNGRFAGARFVVRSAELEYALAPDDPVLAAEYALSELALGTVEYDAVPDERDVDLFADGTVEIVSTPGHSAGHQSVIVRPTAGPPVLVAGDAVWTSALRDDPALHPGLLWSHSTYDTSRDRLLELAERTRARWLFTHDPRLFDDLGWPEGRWIG